MRRALQALAGFRPIGRPDLRTGGTPSLDALAAGTVRLLNWNVHKHVHRDWNRDFHRLLDLYRPDLVHLQEARIEVMQAALSSRPETWCWMAAPNLSLRRPPGLAGVFTAARAPLSGGVALLSEGVEPLFESRKPMLACTLRTREGKAGLLSLNVHSLNFSLGLQAFGAQLDALLRISLAHAGPVLLSGDFNTWSPWRMRMLLGKAEAARLGRVGFAGERPGRFFKGALTLDHAFYSRDRLTVMPLSARTLDSVRSSDHAPMIADFPCPGAPERA